MRRALPFAALLTWLTTCFSTCLYAAPPAPPKHPDATLRIATFDTGLARKGPGLLLRDLLRGEAADIAAVVTTIRAANADVITLQGIDWDYDQRALMALRAALALGYDHVFSAQPNSGLATGVDLNGDGQTNGPEDSQGWGLFTGHRGLAVLSRFPIAQGDMRDFTPLLWADLPDHQMPRYADASPFPSPEAQRAQRLSSTNHWLLPILLPPDGRPLWLGTFRATPPVFDGPEDQNGRRNADEILFWQHLLGGRLKPPLAAPLRQSFALAGNANLDPNRGDGRHDAIGALLQHPALQDPAPRDAAGQSHTVTWERTGPMRVSYILPSAALTVLQAGLIRADADRRQDHTEGHTEGHAHALLWVDLRIPAQTP